MDKNKKRAVILDLLILMTCVLLPACGRRAAALEEAASASVGIGAAAEAPSIEAVEAEPCPYGTDVEKDWPVRICDGFDDNSRDWMEEIGSSDLAEYDIKVADSKYVIDYTGKAHSGYTSGGFTWVPLANGQDFTLSVTGMMDSVNKYIGWGIVFRGSEGNLYLFRITKDGRYALEIVEGGVRGELIEWTTHSAVIQDAPNRLTVTADGSTVELYINGTLLETLTDAELGGDLIALAVMGQEGVRVVYEFDDLIIQAP